MRDDFEIIDRDPISGVLFADAMLTGWQHGEPLGLVVHRQGNPGVPALNAIRWGIRTRAFSIHWYIHGEAAYRCVPEDRHAYHVLEWREAANRGRPVYRSTFMARTPRWLTRPANGQYAGASKPRGDIGMIGIECVDRRGPGGEIYFDQETRITLLLLARDIMLRHARARGDWLRDAYFPITGHATWDGWTRPDDPGQALYLPDFQADLLDLLTGREPWRTVGELYDGTQPMGERQARPRSDVTLALADLKIARGAITSAEGLLGGG
jgi:hypothetical protein